MNQLTITSPAFGHEGDIPSRYSCDGESISPELHIGSLPQNAVTLALIVEDPDAPSGTFDHWIVWNIERTETIQQGANPGISGKNSGGKTGYHPPCPPSGSHRYYFHVYALDTHLDLPPESGKQALRQAMQGHVLAEGTLMGRYSRGT